MELGAEGKKNLGPGEAGVRAAERGTVPPAEVVDVRRSLFGSLCSCGLKFEGLVGEGSWVTGM